jgi:hypothetical protein
LGHSSAVQSSRFMRGLTSRREARNESSPDHRLTFTEPIDAAESLGIKLGTATW